MIQSLSLQIKQNIVCKLLTRKYKNPNLNDILITIQDFTFFRCSQLRPSLQSNTLNLQSSHSLKKVSDKVHNEPVVPDVEVDVDTVPVVSDIPVPLDPSCLGVGATLDRNDRLRKTMRIRKPSQSLASLCCQSRLSPRHRHLTSAASPRYWHTQQKHYGG